MARFLIRRMLLMIPTLLAVSIITFLIIQAPPGDFLSTYISRFQFYGGNISPSDIANMKIRWGLDRPIHIQYLRWLWNLLHGDLGRSMDWDTSVSKLIMQRLPGSLIISLFSLVFVYAASIPIGLYSATHQYSIGDYIFTIIGFVGIAIPSFFFAITLLYLYYVYTGNVSIGLFSTKFQMAPWSFSKFLDLAKHLWMPTIIIGTGGTCGLIRTVRANLLDELQKPYVMLARAKGLSERKLLYKYPFRLAINPIISTIGWTLPGLVSGELLVSIVLNIPTLAPIFLSSLINQDMFFAGSVVFILSALTVIGTLISDILLAWLDPRIREAI